MPFRQSSKKTPPRILVVEDEVIVARDIQQQLKELGFDAVGHATRAEEALDLIATVKPDLVLMDIQLAGPMDGISAAQRVRTEFDLPVVFLTAFAADEVLDRAKLTEPFGYILKPFSERELKTVLEMALYKFKIESELRESRQQLQLLSRRVLEVQETERRRLALELHDELGQALTSIKINLMASGGYADPRSEETRVENIRIVDHAVQQVRRLALALRPSILDDFGLSEALAWLVQQTALRGGREIVYRSNMAELRVRPEVEIACFRIAQEALTNVARHSNSTSVSVELFQRDDVLELTVRDDGTGFDVAQMQARASGGASLGILAMQERATLIGGELAIESAPSKGCVLQMRCPLVLQEVSI